MTKLLSGLIMVVTFFIGLNEKMTSINSIKTVNKENILDHTIWNNLLKKNVSEQGEVNYKAFKQDAEELNNYIDYLSLNVPSQNWSKQEKLAYYINIYNSHTIKLIIDNYPINSIKDIKNPWNEKFIKIGNEFFSLSNIEHEILRHMDEPRIHFAINCASKSCPKLLNTAFTSENVETLLELATKAFINDSEKNKISKEDIQLSKIFDWYKKDFTKNGSLIEYINFYSRVKVDANTKITYLEYDWSLNEQF